MFQYPHKSIFGEESLVLSNDKYQVEICANKVNIFRGDRAWDFDKEDSIEIARNILQKLAPELLIEHTLVKPQTPECDRNSLMNESDRLIRALGWTALESKQYIQGLYRKEKRSLLTDDELSDFAGKLRSRHLETI